MVKYIADIAIESDLCLPEAAAPLVLELTDPPLRLELSNSTDERDKDAVLSAHMTFDAPDIGEARAIATREMERIINSLSFCTNFRFGPFRFRKIVDWTPGLAKREACFFREEPLTDTASPELEQIYVDSIARLLSMQTDEKIQRALRWYRLALRSTLLEEQFMYFWMSLEITAQMLKGDESVPSHCPTCRSKLYCESCQTHPEQTVSGNRAVRLVIRELFDETTAVEVEKTLIKIRNTLAHGRRISSIKNLPCTDEQALEKLRVIAWDTLYGASRQDLDPSPDDSLNVGAPETVVKKRVVAMAHVQIGLMTDDLENPKITDVPDVQVSVHRG